MRASSNIPLRSVRYDEDMDMDSRRHSQLEDDGRTKTSKLQYEGQDIRPTSKKEIYGWYSYGWVISHDDIKHIVDAD